MSIIKAIVVIILIVSISYSLDITISGKVTDTGTTPLIGATVKLEKYGLTASTGSDGTFMLKGTVGINTVNNKLQNSNLSANLHNGLLFVNVMERCNVEIIAFTLQGKSVSRVNKIMDIGTHNIVLPHLGDGVYLYKIKAGKNDLMIKGYTINRISGGTSITTSGVTTTASMSRLKPYVPMDDVIAVTNDGYLNYRVIVTNSDTNNIEIKMIVCAGTVADADGNVYQTVRIGNQVWTVQNLRTTKYSDSTTIPYSELHNLTTPAYYYYNNTTNIDSIKKYGALYNWYAVDTKKLAPTGWHVPSYTEWNTLHSYLEDNGYNWEGASQRGVAKSMAEKADWSTSTTPGAIGNDLRKNNRSGFSALPGGSSYSDIGNKCFMWSDSAMTMTGVWFGYLASGNSDFLVDAHMGMGGSASVRVVKD